MAKKRRVKPVDEVSRTPAGDVAPSIFAGIRPMSIAAAFLGAAIVYVAYHPSDSVGVEDGDALWFGVIALLVATVAWATSFWEGRLGVVNSRQRRVSVLIDVAAWSLAAWMVVGALATSPPGNLRLSTNEAWLWISGAAVFTAARRLLANIQTQRCVVTLMIVCAVGMSIHGLHQQWISLPQTRAEYRANPEKVLRELNISAPPGSAERMVIENRLRDGGPTGTFALANSLAAVLVLGVVALVGVARVRWSSQVQFWICVVVSIVCIACLVAARSRSAIVAAIVATGCLLLLAALQNRESEKGAVVARVVAVLMGVGALALSTLIALASLGNAEWFEQAIPSLAFRLQYWRTTLALALDRPLFGAGPGNFKAIYLQYREPSANEQIAEPHNFLFETLAAGGVIGLSILVLLIIAIVWYSVSRSRKNSMGDEDQTSGWVWMGASVSLALVWLIGAAAGRLPDFQAHVIVVPLVAVTAWLLWPCVRSLSQNELNLIAAMSLVGLLVHLMAAGGWTIPGVAIYIWLLAGMLTRLDALGNAVPARSSAIGAVVFGLALLVILKSVSLTPVQTAQLALAKADYSFLQERDYQAIRLIDEAIQADPWSVQAVLWKSDQLCWQLVRGHEDSQRDREGWRESVELVKSRAGEDPTAWEALGRQYLHVYQRFGELQDLRDADQTFSLVVQWSPADLNAKAQLAVIADQIGDQNRAATLAAEAHKLSTLVNNAERALKRQLILAAKPYPDAAKNGPIRLPASELLANHLREIRVSVGSN